MMAASATVCNLPRAPTTPRSTTKQRTSHISLDLLQTVEGKHQRREQQSGGRVDQATWGERLQ